MSRQRKWAQDAWSAVTSLPPLEKAKFKTRAMKMPSLILQSGLCQAMEYLISRSDSEKGTHAFADAFAKAVAGLNRKALADKVREAKTPDYLRLSRDALEVAAWFRRMAQSELADVKDNDA